MFNPPVNSKTQSETLLRVMSRLNLFGDGILKCDRQTQRLFPVLFVNLSCIMGSKF